MSKNYISSKNWLVSSIDSLKNGVNLGHKSLKFIKKEILGIH